MLWLVALNLAGSIAVLVWLHRRGGAHNALLCVGAVFLFFAFGPLVNVLMDEEVYQGIVEDRLAQASTGFLLALVGLLLADLVLPQRTGFVVDRQPPRNYLLLPLVMVALSGYAVALVAIRGPLMVGADKLERIALAGSWHYPYLLVETFALALWFAARRTPFTHALYWVNAGCYLVYCLTTNERDFIFLGFALLIVRGLFAGQVRSRGLVAFGVVGVALASALATMREGLAFSVAQTLNQGSIPFVDTYVMTVVPDADPYRFGQTYVEAVASVVPRLRVGDRPPLDEWLVSLYAPGSNTGFGFSLTAEAYLNFGVAGIPVVFFLVGLGVRAVVNRCDRSDFTTYLTVVVLAAVCYALRGDSAQLVKSVVYGAVFFGMLHAVSTPWESQRPALPSAARRVLQRSRR